VSSTTLTIPHVTTSAIAIITTPAKVTTVAPVTTSSVVHVTSTGLSEVSTSLTTSITGTSSSGGFLLNLFVLVKIGQTRRELMLFGYSLMIDSDGYWDIDEQ
jgi:hypothetical protein